MSWTWGAFLSGNAGVYLFLLFLPQEGRPSAWEDLRDAFPLAPHSPSLIIPILWPLAWTALAILIWFTTRTRARMIHQLLALGFYPLALVMIVTLPYGKHSWISLGHLLTLIVLVGFASGLLWFARHTSPTSPQSPTAPPPESPLS